MLRNICWLNRLSCKGKVMYTSQGNLGIERDDAAAIVWMWKVPQRSICERHDASLVQLGGGRNSKEQNLVGNFRSLGMCLERDPGALLSSQSTLFSILDKERMVSLHASVGLCCYSTDQLILKTGRRKDFYLLVISFAVCCRDRNRVSRAVKRQCPHRHSPYSLNCRHQSWPSFMPHPREWLTFALNGHLLQCSWCVWTATLPQKWKHS